MILASLLDNFIGPYRSVGWAFRFWPVPVVAFASALAATWLCKRIALQFGIVDRPDSLVKTHREPIAYLGGIGMLVGLTVGILAGIFCLRDEVFFGGALKWLLGVLAGGSIACFVGLADDILDMRPSQKILGQILAAVILVLVGITPNLHRVAEPLGLPMPHRLDVLFGIAIVMFFVLGATNSLNLLDGLDGLCGGVTAIITVAMLVLSVHLATWGYSARYSEVGDSVRIVVCLGLVGGVCGFLPFNRYPAKIFMGDAGSMLLGFVMAALMLMFAEGVPRWWLASIVVFGLPILDTAVALVRRLLNHRPLFVSDRGHIYDQMIDRGISLRKTVAICYALAGIYALIGLVMSQIKTRYAAAVHACVLVVSALVVWQRGYLKMEGLRGAVRDGDTSLTD
ncbi:MAG: undecaprenyl/decaprenyl-phosphate alpha-N-acetylglucosaminyl 1-phosphate transferase [Phycisphaerales bacterium]|nr:MAG: undecaprenyl/decaprenyl-phosphate alpha-N-acetylglucosaminyl 1-phosphate transferase [Phycisphaerales bacterium]